MTHHGRASVPGTTKSAGGDGLDAIEELEGSASGEEDDRVADDGLVGGVDPGDITWKDEENNAHGGHKGGAQNDGRIASIACANRVAAADGLTNTDSSGGGQAQWNHVGECDGVERDLMAGLDHGAEARDQSGHEGKNGNFSGELKCSGKAKGNQFTDTVEVGPDGCLQELGLVVGVVPEQINDENEGEIGAGKARSDAGACDTVGRKAKFAEDQNVVSGEVDEIGTDKGKGNRANHVHALERTAESKVQEEREETGRESAHIGRG